MDVMKNKTVAYCVDFVTVHHFTKFRSHIFNIGDFTEGGTLSPPPVLQGSKKPGINRVKRDSCVGVKLKLGRSGGRINRGPGGLPPGKFFISIPVDCWKTPFLVNNCNEVFLGNWKMV